MTHLILCDGDRNIRQPLTGRVCGALATGKPYLTKSYIADSVRAGRFLTNYDDYVPEYAAKVMIELIIFRCVTKIMDWHRFFVIPISS